MRGEAIVHFVSGQFPQDLMKILKKSVDNVSMRILWFTQLLDISSLALCSDDKLSLDSPKMVFLNFGCDFHLLDLDENFTQEKQWRPLNDSAGTYYEHSHECFFSVHICMPNILYLNIFMSLLSYGPGHVKMCLMPYANNKGADQPAHPRSLISTIFVPCLDSMIWLLAITKVSRF